MVLEVEYRKSADSKVIGMKKAIVSYKLPLLRRSLIRTAIRNRLQSNASHITGRPSYWADTEDWLTDQQKPF